MLKRISKYATAVALEDLSRVMNAGDADGYDYKETLAANWSYQRSPGCDGCFCPASCPDHPFIGKVIKWVKIIARSKHGMTVVFGILPLVLGLLIGFYLGRRVSRQPQKKQRRAVATKVLQPIMRGWLLLRSLAASCLTFLLTAQWKQSNAATTKQAQLEDSYKEIDDETKLDRHRQSGVDLKLIPKHIAFIMDGNRRYGKSKYNSVTRGHKDGGYKLRDMVHWCMEECIQEMTVYAFSTENWNRSPAEIDALMSIFCQQCEDLRKESVRLQIVVRVLSTNTDPIPDHVKEKLKQLEDDTRNCQGTLFLNVCLSYGSRGEIVGACQSLARDCRDGKLAVDEINEQVLESRLLTRKSSSPDIILRTSGEVRISNFLLWQCAYSEFFFLSKHWPDLEKEDLLEVIRTYAHGRKRRFGA